MGWYQKVFTESCLSQHDANCLQEALQRDHFDDFMKEVLMNFLASFEVTGLPHPSNFSAFLIGKVEMIMKPYFSLVHISRSIQSGDESLFQQRLKALQPDGKKLVEILCQLDDEADPHKERVFDFTKRFLGDLRENKASTFLRFVKGFEMVTDYTKKNLNSIQWCH